VSEIPLTDRLTQPATRTAALRNEFDRSFAQPPRLDTISEEDLLTVRVGDDVFAIRLSEIAGLHSDKKVTPVPGGDPALLGIAGFRGTIRSVYSVATLLGLPARAEPRWLAIVADAPIALAFEAIEYHVRVASDTIRPCDASAKEQPYARSFVPIQQLIRPILYLPSLLDAIRARTSTAAQR
jgi:chemotaxis signal transduction protein